MSVNTTSFKTLIDDVQVADAQSIILKLVGEVCNLNCVYCYEKRKPYIGNRVMDPDLALSILSSGTRKFRVELHGGEPLLYPKRHMRTLVDGLATNPRIQGVSIQTNATKLDNEWLSIFGRLGERFELGISLDGPGDANSLRIDYNGKSADSKIISVLEHLSNLDYRIGIIVVVSKTNCGKPKEIIDFLRSFNCISLIKFVPCFDFGVSSNASGGRLRDAGRATNVKPNWSVEPADYADFLNRAFDYWLASGAVDELVIEPFLATIQSIRRMKTDSCIFSSAKCKHVMTVYPDGSVGSCDEFDRESAFYTRSEPTSAVSAPNESFNTSIAGKQTTSLESICAKCNYYTSCQGGCIATRTRMMRASRHQEYCDYRISTIDHIQNWVRGSLNAQ